MCELDRYEDLRLCLPDVLLSSIGPWEYRPGFIGQHVERPGNEHQPVQHGADNLLLELSLRRTALADAFQETRPRRLYVKYLNRSSLFGASICTDSQTTGIPIQMVLWSVVSICQCRLTDYKTFYATRCLLGLVEGGFIPDVVLYLSFFYKSRELPIRLSFFWGSYITTQIISALLAYGILHLRSVTGWAGVSLTLL